MKYVSYLDCDSSFDNNIDWDELIKKLIVDNHSSDWVYCDIGSSDGYYSKFFRGLNGVNKLFSFDINENNFNHYSDIHEVKAVSDKDGLEFYYEHFQHPTKMSNIIGQDVDGQNCEAVKEITSVKLDTYFENKIINCIKIDVEGSELKVIKGGLETIKNSNIVVIECHLDSDCPHIFQLLEENNLEFYELHTNERIKPNVRPYQIYKLI
jgi:FkbM family methyltransferase